MNLILNIISFGVFLVILGGIFFISLYVAAFLLAVLLVAYAGLRIWGYLIKKQIINPRPGYPLQQEDEVIDVEFTRVDEKIEKK